MLRKALHEPGENVHLNPETIGSSDFNNGQFAKRSICQILYCELPDDIFLKRFKQKYFQK
jgi:hypothetical protein